MVAAAARCGIGFKTKLDQVGMIAPELSRDQKERSSDLPGSASPP